MTDSSIGIGIGIGSAVIAQSQSTTKMPPVNDIAVNPFVHKLHLNFYDTVKVALMTVTILPIRVVMAFLCLLLAWSFALIGIHGITTEELRTKPLTGWRRDLLAVTAKLMRGLFVFGGFHWITVKGRRASVEEAPILAVAPHSTYFDALPLVYMGAPSIVAKTDSEDIPFFGKLINYTQPVYVSREDTNSRHTTITEIKKRANSNGAWPQVMIFPEGTCTNRSCLITFKPEYCSVNELIVNWWVKWDMVRKYKKSDSNDSCLDVTPVTISSTSGVPPTSSKEKLKPRAQPEPEFIADNVFVLVRFETEKDGKSKLYVGKVVDIVGNMYEVNFLRKKIGKKLDMFVFPPVPDVSTVPKEQIVSKVEVTLQRRLSYFQELACEAQ